MQTKYNEIMPNSLHRFHSILYRTCWIDSRESILNLFDYDTQANVIDYGCNIGEVTSRILDRIGIRKIRGIDIRKTSSNDDRIEIITADLNNTLPIVNNSVDVIHASNIIEHVSNTDLFVLEMHRILKTGGYAVVSTCNLSAWHNILFLIIGHQIPAADVSDVFTVGVWGKPSRKTLIGPYHRRLFTMRALRELFLCYGFVIERMIGVGFYPFYGKVANFFSCIDRTHAAYIAIKVRKI